MENLTIATSETPKTSKKLGIIAAILVLLFGALAAVYYFKFYQAEDENPPSLTSRSGLQGFLKEGEYKFAHWEEKDIIAYNKYVEETKVKKPDAKPTKVEKGVNHFYADEDITFEQALQRVDSKAKEGVVAQWDPVQKTFLIYPETTYYNKDQTVEVTDPSKQVIKAGQGYYLVVANESEGYGFSSGKTLSKIKESQVCKLEEGWNFTVSNTEKLYDMVKPCFESIKFIWVQDSPVTFKKIYKKGVQEELDVQNYEMKNYYMFWVKFFEKPVIKVAETPKTEELSKEIATWTKKDNEKYALEILVNNVVIDTITVDPAKLEESNRTDLKVSMTGDEITAEYTYKKVESKEVVLSVSVTKPTTVTTEEESGKEIAKWTKKDNEKYALEILVNNVVIDTITVDPAKLEESNRTDLKFSMTGDEITAEYTYKKVEGKEVVLKLSKITSTVVTKEEEPDKVTKLQAPDVDLNDGDLTIIIDVLTHKPGEKGYMIKITDEKGETSTTEVVRDKNLDGKKVTYITEVPAGVYKVQVAAFDDGEKVGEYTTEQSITISDLTPAETPKTTEKISKPKNAVATIVGNETKLEWDSPELKPGQKISGYGIQIYVDGKPYGDALEITDPETLKSISTGEKFTAGLANNEGGVELPDNFQIKIYAIDEKGNHGEETDVEIKFPAGTL